MKLFFKLFFPASLSTLFEKTLHIRKNTHLFFLKCIWNTWRYLLSAQRSLPGIASKPSWKKGSIRQFYKYALLYAAIESRATSWNAICKANAKRAILLSTTQKKKSHLTEKEYPWKQREKLRKHWLGVPEIHTCAPYFCSRKSISPSLEKRINQTVGFSNIMTLVKSDRSMSFYRAGSHMDVHHSATMMALQMWMKPAYSRYYTMACCKSSKWSRVWVNLSMAWLVLTVSACHMFPVSMSPCSQSRMAWHFRESHRLRPDFQCCIQHRATTCWNCMSWLCWRRLCWLCSQHIAAVSGLEIEIQC